MFSLFRSPRDISWGPFSLVINGHCVSLQRVKRPERDVDLSFSPSGVETKDRKWLYPYSPFAAAWHVKGRHLFTFPCNMLQLFCLGVGEGRFLRNVGTFLSAYVQSSLRIRQLHRSVCLYALQCNAARHIPLSRSLNPVCAYLVGLLIVDTSFAKCLLEEEDKNLEKLQTHSDALNLIRTHGPNMRIVVVGRRFKHHVKTDLVSTQHRIQ